MAWWQRLFSRKTELSPEDREYRVACCLYSMDGKRSVEVRERRDGRVYFVDRVWVEGTTFKDRKSGEETGPYESPEAAEMAAVARPWFAVGENSN